MATTTATAKSEGRTIEIKAPHFETLELRIEGTTPFVQHKFSQKAKEQIMATQSEGKKAGSKRTREPKDFEAIYQGAMHKSRDGWIGIPASAFRNGMISACRTVGYKMTHAKLAVYVMPDGFDNDDGMPLVQIYGEPKKHSTYARNDNGGVDIRVRPMWEVWHAIVRIRFDADMFSAADVVNLMMRVGMQVGIGEGRPDSKDSAGLGWGLFSIAENTDEKEKTNGKS